MYLEILASSFLIISFMLTRVFCLYIKSKYNLIKTSPAEEVLPDRVPFLGSYFLTKDGIYVKIIFAVPKGYTDNDRSGCKRDGPCVEVLYIAENKSSHMKADQFWRSVERSVLYKEEDNINSVEQLLSNPKISEQIKRKIIFNMSIFK